MALQTANPPTINGAQLVGNAFVEQYYHILHHSPELVYRFYQDISVLSRPDANGAMMLVTTMQGINEKICSLDYKNYKAEIKTADALLSYKDGVTVLVTGCLTGKDNLRRKFSQSFFLAPQDNGYFVLNDVFRYVEDVEPLEIHPVDVVDDAPVAPLASAPETIHVLDPPAADPAISLVEDQNVVEKAVDPIDQEQVVTEKVIDVESQTLANGNDTPAVIEAASSSNEDAPKQSYASIVKVTKGSSLPTKVYLPTTVKMAHKKAENQSVGSAAPAPAPLPEASAPSNIDSPENSDAPEEVEGHSIYIRNLPLNVTVPQLELEFNKFGPIKPGGVQVRNHKQGYCFGFVEFLSFDSMDKAIQASPVTIGGRQAVVEIKKTSTRVGNGRGGRFPPGRGGFRNDNFRGRGNYGGGGRGFVRNDYGNRGEFSSGRGRGPAGRGGDGYQPGRGRGGGRTWQSAEAAAP